MSIIAILLNNAVQSYGLFPFPKTIKKHPFPTPEIVVHSLSASDFQSRISYFFLNLPRQAQKKVENDLHFHKSYLHLHGLLRETFKKKYKHLYTYIADICINVNINFNLNHLV